MFIKFARKNIFKIHKRTYNYFEEINSIFDPYSRNGTIKYGIDSHGNVGLGISSGMKIVDGIDFNLVNFDQDSNDNTKNKNTNNNNIDKNNKNNNDDRHKHNDKSINVIDKKQSELCVDESYIIKGEDLGIDFPVYWIYGDSIK